MNFHSDFKEYQENKKFFSQFNNVKISTKLKVFRPLLDKFIFQWYYLMLENFELKITYENANYCIISKVQKKQN